MAPTPAPAAVVPPTIIAVRFQSRPDRRSTCDVCRGPVDLVTRRATGADPYGSPATPGRTPFTGFAIGVRSAYGAYGSPVSDTRSLAYTGRAGEYASTRGSYGTGP